MRVILFGSAADPSVTAESEANDTIAFYRKYVFPALGATQSVLMVPGLFDCRPGILFNGQFSPPACLPARTYVSFSELVCARCFHHTPLRSARCFRALLPLLPSATLNHRI